MAQRLLNLGLKKCTENFLYDQSTETCQTNSSDQSTSWEAYKPSNGIKTRRILRNPKAPYRVGNSPPPVLIILVITNLMHKILFYNKFINPLNAELNPICHLLALLGTHPYLLTYLLHGAESFLRS